MFNSIDSAATCPAAKLDRPWQLHGAVSVQLKVKIMRQQAAREQKLRRKNLTKYIPNAAAAVFKVLQSMAQAPAVGSKRRRLQAEEDILEPVTRGETVEATLAQRLTEYVERIDTDMVSTVQARSVHRAVCGFVSVAVLVRLGGITILVLCLNYAKAQSNSYHVLCYAVSCNVSCLTLNF